ncbi:hypothetical protein GCM10025868_44960 [Angustibacter aerolatus]|uniref:G domain-containing protein n=1 Tax=Angustibacter aerolatus TaxID=1162965 RepID=A0ABQ6JLU5_9ACTN|nr:hypothetical protein GCM10025868_44960 [Angustibacter aerolatus]
MLFVVDAMVGTTDTDEAIVKVLRRSGKPVVLAANKVDDLRGEAEAAALWSLGLGEPYVVSGLHGRGSGDLLDVVLSVLPETSQVGGAVEEGGPRRVALLGRPNVGKSSLLNKAVGSERVVVDDVPGTTRDPVDEPGRAWPGAPGGSSTPRASAAACTRPAAPTSTPRCARRPRWRRPRSPSC